MFERLYRHVIRPRASLFLRLCVCSLLLTSQPAFADPGTIDRLLEIPALRGGVTGCLVESLDDHKVVYERDADLRLMPASNRKLFTTAAVLGLLGPDFAISTPVLAAGPPDATGTVTGDAYLRGAGDSALGPADLDTLAKAVAAGGVKHIAGGIVGDGGVFEDGPYGTNWGWDTLNDDYAPAIDGLDANDGVVTIDVTPGASAGAPASYTIDPPTSVQPIDDEATTVVAGGPVDVTVRHPWRKDVIVIAGAVPVGGHKRVEIPVADPVLFTADLFRSALVKAGVTVDGPASTGQTPSTASTVLAAHKSPPMSAYVALMNKPSDNLLAESLIRVIGVAKSGHGTYDAGDDAEMAYFKSAGLDVADITLDDGSGVSRRNYVTARSVVDLLVYETGQPTFAAFLDSLPVAGVDGTLRHRFKGTAGASNVRAKTGTLTGAAALSGYFTGKSGRRYAFSLIMNNYTGTADEVRDVQDNVVVDLIDTL